MREKGDPEISVGKLVKEIFCSNATQLAAGILEPWCAAEIHVYSNTCADVATPPSHAAGAMQ